MLLANNIFRLGTVRKKDARIRLGPLDTTS